MILFEIDKSLIRVLFLRAQFHSQLLLHYIKGHIVLFTLDLPYFGLVQCYGYQLSWGYIDKEQGIKLAEENFAKGYQLNENSEEAFFALANKYLWADWNKEEAISNLKKALTLKQKTS